MSGETGNPPALVKPLISERRLLLLLAAVQFTHIVDFMIMMPLGPQLMRELGINTLQFGGLISSFAITAGVVGLAVAPFADRFDRRKLLLFCYAGFTLGTLACGLSNNTATLLVARAICGAFGGVSGATIMAIVADVVPPERRAHGMGVIMTAFSAAAALGVPLGLKIAQWWKWEGPFLTVAAVGAVVWIGLFRILPPVRGHLTEDKVKSVSDFLGLLRDGNAWTGLALMATMVLGHFTLIPYLAPHLVGNVGLPETNLFLIYLTGGLVTVFTGPLIGKLADRHGRFRVYCVLVGVACVVIRLFTSSGPQPVWLVLLMAAFFFACANGRFVPGQAVISLAVPPARRGAYMSLVACSRDLAAGLTATLGSHIVIQGANGRLLHFDRLGWLAIGASIISLWIFKRLKTVE
ncbi:MAG: MFS transporter [Luteolibacter sp.]|uniref:MFS transporter n=1 Tax=Luteolibacter sp. TaxID=1962973 RepID=UPI0032667CDB